MSYSVPGPGRDRDLFGRKWRKEDETSIVAQARQAAEQLSPPKPPKPPKPPQVTEVTGSRPARPEEEKVDVGPPVLDRLLRHERERSSARAAGDGRLADRALGQVVGDLDELLDTATEHLRQAGRGRSRQRVREALPQLVAMSGVAALPLGEAAEFLELPREQVEDVLCVLARHGGITPAERHEALRQVTWLRGQLRQVEVTKDHSLLDRVLRFVSKFVLFGVVALASAASGALAVGDPVIEEVVKAGVVALVAAALQLAVNRLLSERAEPGTTARAAHTALLAELGDARALWEEQAYDGEHLVLRIRLGIRCCAARVASIPLDWEDKRHYWELLDALAPALADATPAELISLSRRIAALGPPTP